MNRRPTSLVAVVVTAAVLAGACSDSTTTESTAGTTATSTTTSETVAGDTPSPDSSEDLAAFTVDGTTATMAGTISTPTPDAVRSLLADHPEVTTIVMTDVPGSADDEANLEAARLIREAGIATHANADSVLASGGVDFYLAGATRTYDEGAQFGVHSWGGAVDGSDVPRDDPQHQLYLDYYAEIGIDAEFYWFTLEAAPASGIHWMTAAELERYGFAT